MNGWSLSEIARLCGGRLEHAGDPARVCPYGAVAIDSRRIEPGQVFVAVRGERDGHDYLADAASRGAIAAIVREGHPCEVPDGLPLIRAADTVAALQSWAAGHRSAMPAEVIIVTGSSGKTTTKDRLSSILATAAPTHATPGNLNNHLGVPITLLGIAPRHRWAVVEIAMNHPGEIAPLSRLARPAHVVITTVGWAHIGAFGTREAILAEKLQALAGLEPGGILFHENDPWFIQSLPAETRLIPRRSFGLDGTADLLPERIEWGLAETRFATDYTGTVRYRCPGRGPLQAAIAACLVARTLGVPGASARRSVEEAVPRPLRMEPRPLHEAMALLDCYNASPESSLSAVDFLLSVPVAGRRWLAFGEMRELGERSAEAHRRVGERAAALDGAFFLGEACRPAFEAFRGASRGLARIRDTVEELARDLRPHLANGDVVLIKGARAMAMERVYDACLRMPAGKEA